MSLAPDLIQPVIGFRQWRLRDDHLQSLVCDEPWPAPTLTARCRAGRHPDEPAPASECACGIYAWYRPSPRTASAATADIVDGAVVMWGAIELHPTGMRGQHCRVVALGLPLSRWRKRRRLLAIADRIGVPVVPHRALASHASRCGGPVPKALIPAPLPLAVAWSRPSGPPGWETTPATPRPASR